MSYYNYDYKKKDKKDGDKLITIRDIDENALLEVERKGDEVKLVIYWQNQKTVGFKLPIEVFENLYKDIAEND
ncbi:hypothetical protein COJ85_33015 [Bacillus sp. AFS076308]|uniref:hypothetical protein n=1 Tax=unclassified Bacillus (in: firmicutes) TaxID=185979 RepID=UPI000BF6338B|nr:MULTISPECIES: hypothetical protein [unclassified Bacillus (in: firmicutes)]PFN76206.1 hypothetical protein COJ85_33015 [Bacillus sp. AFS076308]PGV48329.1 hypothetical protein COD92_26815 [Bacillus sp. AFS037270]